MKTLNLEEAAELLKVHIETLGRLAKTGQLPGAKIGRAWVFLEEDLVDYLREQIQKQQTKRLEESAGRGKENPKTPAQKRTKKRRPVSLDV